MVLNQRSLTEGVLRDGFVIGYKAAYGKRTCSERTFCLAGRYWVHHKWKGEVKPAEFKWDIRPVSGEGINPRNSFHLGVANSALKTPWKLRLCFLNRNEFWTVPWLLLGIWVNDHRAAFCTHNLRLNITQKLWLWKMSTWHQEFRFYLSVKGFSGFPECRARLGVFYMCKYAKP